jgi:hypothetical protein
VRLVMSSKASKICAKCGVDKPFKDFYKYKRSLDGHQSYCKQCTKVATDKFANSDKRKEYLRKYREANFKDIKAGRDRYKELNKERIATSNKIYRETNRRRVRESQQRYKESNYDKVLEASREYRTRNRHKYAAYSSRRRAAEKQAQPSWLDKDDLKRIELVYGLRELKSFVTRQEYEVDHIVPLRGKTVCGLHVPWNLRVIPKIDNRKKHALYWPDMWTKEDF